MKLFKRDPYSLDEIHTYMADIQALQAASDKNMNNYRLSQVRQPDGTVRRDENYRKLAEQQLDNVKIANVVLEQILSKMKGKES